MPAHDHVLQVAGRRHRGAGPDDAAAQPGVGGHCRLRVDDVAAASPARPGTSGAIWTRADGFECGSTRRHGQRRVAPPSIADRPAARSRMACRRPEAHSQFDAQAGCRGSGRSGRCSCAARMPLLRRWSCALAAVEHDAAVTTRLRMRHQPQGDQGAARRRCVLAARGSACRTACRR